MSLIALACLCVTVRAQAATGFYIDPVVGNDANPCTSWSIIVMRASIQGALQCVTIGAGDFITLLPGTYQGALNTVTEATAVSGSNPDIIGATVIQASDSSYVEIQPPLGTPAIALTSKSNLYFKNLHINCTNLLAATPCVTFTGTSAGSYFRRTEIYNAAGDCVVLGSGTSGLHFFGFTKIHDCGGWGVTGPLASGLFDQLEVYNTDGVNLTGGAAADFNIIRYSKIHNNVDGVILGDNAGGNNNEIYNSLLYDNTGVALTMKGDSTKALQLTVTGNGQGVVVAASATNNVVENVGSTSNTSNNILNNGTATTLTTNSTAAASFTNAGAHDYTLQAGSAWIDAATTTGSPWDRDYLKILVRNNTTAWDIGAYETPPGCPAGVCTVLNGQDLQASLNRAKCGDTIKMEDGKTWSSIEYVLPSKNTPSVRCTSYTTLTRTGTLPAVQSVLTLAYQLGPTFAAEMAKRDAGWAALKTAYETNAPKILVPDGSNSVGLRIGFDTDYWRIQGIEIYTDDTDLNFAGGGFTTVNTLFILGKETDEGVSTSQLPDHIEIDRTSIHGSGGGFIHGMEMQGTNISWQNSICYGAMYSENDSQCLHVPSGAGPYTIDNVFCEGGAECVLFGGTTGPYDGVIPGDAGITVHDSYFTLDWRWWPDVARLNAFGMAYVYYGQTSRGYIKNRFEGKDINNLNFYRNVLDTQWDGGQQWELMIFETSRDEGLGFWQTVKNLHIWGNTFRHSTEAFIIGAYADTMPAYNIVFEHNLIYNMDGVTFFEGSANSRGCFKIISGSTTEGNRGGREHYNGYPIDPIDGIVFNHNTCDTVGQTSFGNIGNAVTCMGPPIQPFCTLGDPLADKFKDMKITNNLVHTEQASPYEGSVYFDAAAFSGTHGTAGFNYVANCGAPCGSVSAFNYNAISTATAEVAHPAPSWFPGTVGNAAQTLIDWKALFVNRDASDYHLAPGSIYAAGGARQANDGLDLGANLSLGPGGGGTPTPPAPSTAPARLRFHVRAGDTWLDELRRLLWDAAPATAN